MTRSPSIAVLLLLSMFIAGCVRRQGRNSDCHWISAQPPANPPDLPADLEFAEDLAIRYMEAHAGPRDQVLAAKAKNACLTTLLKEIGKEHGISAQEAFRSFGQRPPLVDFLINLPLLFALALAANFGFRRLLLRYPPSQDPRTAVAITVFASFAFAAAGLLLAQQWAAVAESIRVGTGHLSNRALRLPVNQHPALAFAFLVLLFLSIAARRYKSASKHSTPVLS